MSTGTQRLVEALNLGIVIFVVCFFVVKVYLRHMRFLAQVARLRNKDQDRVFFHF